MRDVEQAEREGAGAIGADLGGGRRQADDLRHGRAQRAASRSLDFHTQENRAGGG